MKTPELEELRAFRQHVYTLFGCRRDALCELLDALLSAPSIETPAHLSLVPSCQRGWGSFDDALNAGTMDLEELEHLVACYPPSTTGAWYAVDASVWPRCDAPNSSCPWLLSPSLPPFPWPADGRRLELFLAGAGAGPLLELDRAVAGAPADSGRARQCSGCPADPLVAAPGATGGARRPPAHLQLRCRLRRRAVEAGPG